MYALSFVWNILSSAKSNRSLNRSINVPYNVFEPAYGNKQACTFWRNILSKKKGNTPFKCRNTCICVSAYMVISKAFPYKMQWLF